MDLEVIYGALGTDAYILQKDKVKCKATLNSTRRFSVVQEITVPLNFIQYNPQLNKVETIKQEDYTLACYKLRQDYAIGRIECGWLSPSFITQDPDYVTKVWGEYTNKAMINLI